MCKSNCKAHGSEAVTMTLARYNELLTLANAYAPLAVAYGKLAGEVGRVAGFCADADPARGYIGKLLRAALRGQS